MALGGGYFEFYNKKLPGSYINFVSKLRTNVDIADRGYATVALPMDWGKDGEIFTVYADEVQKQSMEIFGYEYTNDKLKPIRDLFLGAKCVHFYKLNNGGLKAKNDLAEANYAGVRGNDITVAILPNLDAEDSFDVVTYMMIDGARTTVDKQIGKETWEDVQSNKFVRFLGTGKLIGNAGESLAGGGNGTAITGAQYQEYIDKVEPYYFNTMAYAGTDQKIQDLLIAYQKRMREQMGAKFQLVLYDREKVDYEGVISVKNAIVKDKDSSDEVGALVYWVAGVEAGCKINRSTTNKPYNGNYVINTSYKQSELEKAIDTGMYIFHNVADRVGGDTVGISNVLVDINTFTSFSKEKNKEFANNQVIRVLDQAGTDIARLFNKMYLGKEQNDSAGRIALWNDIVALMNEYQRVRAIQNFDSEDVEIPRQGQEKGDVVVSLTIQPTSVMDKLYMTIIVA